MTRVVIAASPRYAPQRKGSPDDGRARFFQHPCAKTTEMSEGPLGWLTP